MTDIDLLDLFASGDKAAFNEIVTRYQQRLVACIERRFPHLEAADIVQHTFASVARCHQQFDRGKSFRAWLFAIAINHARNVIKTQNRAYTIPLSAMNGFDVAEQDIDKVEQADMGRRVICLLDTLPAKDKQAMKLVYLGEVPYRDAAKQLGIPLGSLKTRINRSLKYLREVA